MAITPRTILTSAAPATVAVVSLYFFTVLGTAAFTCLNDSEEPPQEPVVDNTEVDESVDEYAGCRHVTDRLADDSSQWSELSWVRLADCLDDRDRSEQVVKVAEQGLEQHPKSEILFNLKGYHQIKLDDHDRAIETLRSGMSSVQHHRNGVMANNLAWAGLWEPREMQLDEARDLYVESLARSPEICETIHTGLFVEFALAEQAEGIDQFEPRKRFGELRNRYNRCLDRLQEGDRETLVEVLGAAVLFEEVDRPHSHSEIHPLMHSTTAVLADQYEDESAESLCEDAMPLADYHHKCVESVERSLEAHERLARQREQRNQRADRIKKEIRIVEHDGEFRKEIRVEHAGNLEPVESGCGGMDAE